LAQAALQGALWWGCLPRTAFFRSDRMGREEERPRREEEGGGGGDRGDKDRAGGKDRDKKDKKKRRSASSDSAERSREREKRRRKQQQANVTKPKAGEIGAGGPVAAGAGQRMFWDGFQWVPRAETAGANDPNVSRKMRRLYLGNLPYHLGVTEDSFSKQMYETLRDRGLCNDPNTNPVLHVWFAREKGANYGFCEIATIEECDRALQLDGMLVLGVPISMKRPNDAQTPQGMLGGVIPGMPMGAMGGPMLALPGLQVTATSTIIQIEEILKVDDKTTPDDFSDVIEDMNEGCGAHGKLLGAVIIKQKDLEQNPTGGLRVGDVYLRCASTDDATKVMRAMGHRKYDGRQIQMKSYDEARFEKNIKPIMG